MFKVGLTGNFYSGLDEVANIFENKGILIWDADLIFKFMINYSEEHILKIQKTFGKSIYRMGTLEMKNFDDNESFEKLLNVLELDMMKAYEKWRIKNWNQVYTIFKSSILLEKKFNSSMNFNINVFKPQRERRIDIITNTSYPLATVDHILDNEMSEFQKNGKCDFVIHNYSAYHNSQNSLSNQIDNINRAILKKKHQSII